MERERRIWLGFTAIVIFAVMFVLGRDDDNTNRSQLSAGTSVPSSTVAPSTTAGPTTTSSATTTSSTGPSTTTPPTTQREIPATTEGTVATTPPPTEAPTTVPPTTEPAQVIQFGRGTYRIGTELPAGTYRTDGVGRFCYWFRLSSFTGTADSVIAGGPTNGAPATVTIEPSDAGFTTDGCAVWQSL